MDGIVFNIQRFSIHDGPGIRTTVFLKGCNLSCFWCHNPESRSLKPEIQFFPEKCILCGKCVEVCPNGAQQIIDGKRYFDRSLCDQCGKCVETCYAKALTLAGEDKTFAEIMDEIRRDELYYKNSGGGVTFSGGEPLLQSEFLKELLIGCKQAGYHTAVDTAGNVRWQNFLTVLPYTDLFLFDVKVLAEEKHRKVTGTGNTQIHQNLIQLGASGAKIHVRIPVIPGVNDEMGEIQAIAQFLQPIQGIELVELLPFHHLGSGKYRSLGLEYPTQGYKTPPAEQMEGFVNCLKEFGLNATRSA